MAKNGNGARKNDTEGVTISMPGWLLDEIDSARARLDQQRSDFIRKAVRLYILQLKDTPEFWKEYTKKNPHSLVNE